VIKRQWELHLQVKGGQAKRFTKEGKSPKERQNSQEGISDKETKDWGLLGTAR